MSEFKFQRPPHWTRKPPSAIWSWVLWLSGETDWRTGGTVVSYTTPAPSGSGKFITVRALVRSDGKVLVPETKERLLAMTEHDLADSVFHKETAQVVDGHLIGVTSEGYVYGDEAVSRLLRE